MKYSQSTELAIDSLFFMAAHPQVSAFSVEDIAQAQQVSVSYLAKVFQQLVKAGLLRSNRGAKGGYALSRPPSQITLLDIAVVFEGSSALYDCSAVVRRCSGGAKCLIRSTFGEAEKRLHEVLRGVSLQDIVNHNAQAAGWVNNGVAVAELNGQPAAEPVDTTPNVELKNLVAKE